jgi:hypothetical protein
MLVNYRVDLGRLDAALPGPCSGREVGETGKGIGTVCLARVEKDRGIEPEGGSEGTDEGKKVATAGRKEERRTEERSRGNPRTREAATKGSGEAETSAGIEDGSVFYSPGSASVFLCDGGVEYMPAGHRDGRYKRVEPSAEERRIEPVNVTDSKSSYFEKMGGEFDSAFVVEGIEQEWEIGGSVTRR